MKVMKRFFESTELMEMDMFIKGLGEAYRDIEYFNGRYIVYYNLKPNEPIYQYC